MFRLLRTFGFVLLAFFAGLMFERGRASSLCTDAGGNWQNGICTADGADQ